MAYKKAKTRSTGKRTSWSNSRKRTTSRAGRKSSGSARRSVSTLRIVVEQPQAVSSVVPAQNTPARKAVF